MAAQAGARALELEWPRRRVQTGWKKWAQIARRKYTGTFSALIILTLVVVAITAPIIAPYDPLEVHTEVALQPPQPGYWLGTDELGRDLLSRLIYGSRVSLFVGFGAVAIGGVVGVTIGLTSAYFRGRYDLIMQRIIDAWQSFPSLILAMAIVATLGSSLFNVILAISINGITGKARIVRGTALSIMQNQYVEGARAIGCSNLRIMALYVLPNCWAPVIVIMSIALGGAILAEASLSFLGLGPPPPNPTWGSMLSGSSRNYMSSAPWMAIWPGVAITSVVLAFNLLGDTLRDILDPRMRGTQ